ncbi:MAG: hypothetical protein VB048_00010 [Bacteroidaceae bacterium]|jgi:hypothetical protein|nr:hypothetical protein [Bacteroidales bacterium]MEA4966487.1 hypothetical protein [Bacteroidaceae bacterium]MEA5100225.1 hypothetical protein [Bacteroidales bacterium]
MESIKKNFVIEWKGPYYDIQEIKNEEFQNCFYLLTGLKKYDRGLPEIQYCGISFSRSIYQRLLDRGHKQNDIKWEKQIWIGGLSNKRLNTKKNIELVEHLIIYYWQPILNNKKKHTPPSEPISIINRWKNKKGLFLKKITYPAQHIDDVILFDGKSFWSSNKLKKEREII